ncbi:DNA alkylation repair protein [Rhizobium sp. TH2]|uniref:DNA alkylation repair protein n=1 Tax=Rhizobium sp. TH2 TaxID=2775403 RepID=UPI0021577D66|nr:DNA alkylation repair protein [Rhizobium sp. TH2]UVC11521.1 DNA alkylation repair protein [Rhizobium sp. TH2]
MTAQTADAVEAALRAIASPDMKTEVARFFFDGLGETEVMGVGIGKVFPVAKAHAGLPLGEIGLLLDSRFYEVRMAAAAIMDFQARAKKSPNGLEALYQLYLDRHDRLNNWDLVDRAAPHVVGQYLFERPRAPLYDLAGSTDPWRRRTAVVATWYFIRAGQVEDTFAICAILAGDGHVMVRKAIGSWVRTAGEKDPERLRAFLRAHGDRLSAEALRMATEKMSPEERQLFRKQ